MEIIMELDTGGEGTIPHTLVLLEIKDWKATDCGLFIQTRRLWAY